MDENGDISLQEEAMWKSAEIPNGDSVSNEQRIAQEIKKKKPSGFSASAIVFKAIPEVFRHIATSVRKWGKKVEAGTGCMLFAGP